jgi:hypothetical protein
MIVESATETYQFACVRCDRRWRDSYDVRDVTDADGDTWSFYLHDGLACEAPSAAETLCPQCRCGPVHVERRSRVLLTSTDLTTPDHPLAAHTE